MYENLYFFAHNIKEVKPVWPVFVIYLMVFFMSKFLKVKVLSWLSDTTWSVSMLMGDWCEAPQKELGRRFQWDTLCTESGEENSRLIRVQPYSEAPHPSV